MRELDNRAVISLLRAEVKRAGGVMAWSKKQRIHRATISRALNGHSPPTKGIIKALGLRIIVVSAGK
jgi:DNA-binding phage protein